MMSSYLLIDAVLPTGLNYLNLSELAIPSSLVTLGGNINYFNFASGLPRIEGLSEIVGSITEGDEGCYLGNAGYIDTNRKETEEFTWVTLAKVSDYSKLYSPIISNFGYPNGVSSSPTVGNSLTTNTLAVKMTDGVNSSASVFKLVSATDKWVLIVLSRKKTVGGYKYHLAAKSQGTALQEKSSEIGTASTNTTNNVCIGWAQFIPAVVANHSTLVNFASIHDVGVEGVALNSLVTNLIADVADIGVLL